MECTERFERKMEEFYRQNPPAEEQIKHTANVASLTARLAQSMGCGDRETELLVVAALLHDVGCPKARSLHGKALPTFQEQYGREIAQEWLENEPELSPTEKEWIANVVGLHHHPRQATEMGFRPLFEADTIVNMGEGYYKEGQEQHIYDTLMETVPGRSLFAQMFLKK